MLTRQPSRRRDLIEMSRQERENSDEDDVFDAKPHDLGEQLEVMARRVKAGELDPTQATSLLLAETPASTENQNLFFENVAAVSTKELGESLESLIGRLGTPPDDIIDAWCKQLCCAALIHHHETGHSLPVIAPSKWSVDHEGHLIWNGFMFVSHDDQWPEPDRGSLINILAFRESLLPEAKATESKHTPPAIPHVPGLRRETTPSKSKLVSEKHTKPRAAKTSKRGQYIGGGLLAASLAVMAAILVNVNAKKPEAPQTQSVASSDVFAPGKSQLADASSQLAPEVTSDSAADVLSTEPIGESSEGISNADSSPSEFATLESSETAVGSSNNIDDASGLGLDVSVDMSLGSLIPNSTTSAEETSPASDDTNPDNTDPDNTDPAAKMPIGMGDGPTVDPLADNDSPSPDESPQTTRTAETAAIELPPIGERETRAELIAASAAESLTLDFPFSVNLSMKPTESSKSVIQNSQNEEGVGYVTLDDGAANFQWAEQAARVSGGTSLLHGRIRAGDDVVFLRPVIEADALTFEFDRADIQPTWDLRGPIPPRITRLAVELDVPEEVELGWVEPIDPADLRRTRGVAVFQSKDNEKVAMGMRFDIRCSRKLSIRIRFAGRLDAQAPWQLVSQPMLDQLANNVANQQTRISAQITQVSTAYSTAPSYQKRSIRDRRDALEDQAETLREFARRLADFQGLMTQLQAGAQLKLRVWVQWPDGTEQSLLATKATGK